MKPVIGIIALISVLLPASAAADEATAEMGDTSQVSGTWINGVKGGASWSSLGGDVTNEAGSHFGANVGYFFSYRLGNGLAVQPELLVGEKGGSDAVFDDSGREADIIVTYLDLPVLARYNAPLAGDFKPYGYGGPQLSYNIDATRKTGTDGIDYEDDIKDFDVGFAVGAGVDWYLGKQTGVTLDARFSMGLLSIDDSPDDDSIKNRVISVMFGIWR